MTLVIITLRHFFHLLASSASVSAEALACATGVVTDTTARAVLTRHSTVATVNLAAIGIQNVLTVVVTLGQVRLFVIWLCRAFSVGVSLFPACTSEGSVVLQLVVRDCGAGSALVIKGISRRGALHQSATWTTVARIALATVVHVSVPCVVVGSEVGFLEQLSEVFFVGLDLGGLSNCPVVGKVPVGTASSVTRAVVRASSTLA
jgi:non-ribosomal peptide synthetase component E (peptide arylation enzyme)